MRCGTLTLHAERGVLTVEPHTLTQIEAALRASWSFETCDTDDQHLWSVDNPARGHCGVTALVIADLLGGVLLEGLAFRDGVQVGYHYWNRLPSGIDIDLTREQFRDNETVSEPRVVQPQLPGPLHKEAYALLAKRVADRLGPTARSASPAPAG